MHGSCSEHQAGRVKVLAILTWDSILRVQSHRKEFQSKRHFIKLMNGFKPRTSAGRKKVSTHDNLYAVTRAR